MKKDDIITLAHGGGGKASRELIQNEIIAALGSLNDGTLSDAAALRLEEHDLLFTTDSFVVHPYFFPGGDIGELSVFGTVNDIAVSGGKPRYLSLGFILEEGFPLSDFRRILASIAKAVVRCGVKIVTGDTKVVRKGQCDGIYINTAGIGTAISGFNISVTSLREGDAVLVSGGIAEHGMAVMCARGGIEIKDGPQSDAAPVSRLVSTITEMASGVRFMRDPTRGGLAAVLNEAVEGMPIGIEVEESLIPVSSRVKAVADLLGIDPLQAPSEGRVVLVCAPDHADSILKAWRSLPEGKSASMIGRVTDKAGTVVLQTITGGRRLIDLPRGELLPRIC